MIIVSELPCVRQAILRTLSQHGGRFKGTQQLCECIDEDPRSVHYAIRRAHHLGLVRCSHPRGTCGRGNLTVWYLTQKGWHYVQS